MIMTMMIMIMTMIVMIMTMMIRQFLVIFLIIAKLRNNQIKYNIQFVMLALHVISINFSFCFSIILLSIQLDFLFDFTIGIRIFNNR